ncbi:MAG: hypothetical protein LBH66_06215, partial [Oscillospiraceae bacterium]|nr:hypothetical protein [Oscillospiraceae bacterium]
MPDKQTPGEYLDAAGLDVVTQTVKGWIKARVAKTTKINNHALTGDVTLEPHDIGAAPANATLTDAAAARTLPATTSSTLASLLQTARNCLKWLAARFDASGNANAAVKLAAARTITLTGDVTGSVSTDLGTNPSIATTLANSGVTAGKVGEAANKTLAFGGSFIDPEITVDAKGRVTALAARTITLPAAPTSVSGNAGTATKLAAARTITLTGDVTGSVSTDLGANPSISTTLANSGVTAGKVGEAANKTLAFGGSFIDPEITVDAKGRVTALAARTITLPAAPTSVSGNAGTAT